MKTLDEVLSYSNHAIIRAFRDKFDISEEETEDIFRETKKFLWLCALSRDASLNGSACIPKKLFVHRSMLVIDQLWHIFIINTRFYVGFCEHYLGGYIHHTPTELGSTGPTEEENECQLSFVYDHLGEDTLIKWYDTYEEKYSPVTLQTLLKPEDLTKDREKA